MQNRLSRLALRVSVIYGLLAGGWILFSDRVLGDLLAGREQLTHFQSYKGLLFVGVTAMLLYAGLRQQIRKLTEEMERRRRTEERLRVNEERFRLAQHVARVGTFEWNVQTGANYWTPELEAMHGLPAGGFARTQAAWEDMLHPGDRPVVLARVQDALATGAPGEGEWRIIRPDGGERWIYGWFQLFRDATGRPERLIGVNIDVTDRKRAEEELLRSEKMLLNSWDGVTLFAADGEILYVSPSQTRILGHPLEDLLGRKAVELVHPDDHELLGSRLGECMQRPGVGVSIVARARHRDGSWRWLEGVFTNLLHEPAVRAIVNNYRDITERHRAEEELRKSEERLRQVLDGLGPHVYMGLMDTTGRLLFVNRPALAMGGLQAGEVVGKPLEDTSWAAHSDAVRQRFQDAIQRAARGEFVRYDEQVRAAGGRLIWIDLSIHPVRDESGRVAFLVPSAREISERKQAEMALKESQRQYATLIANLPGAVYRCRNDRDWPVDFVSDGILQLTGFPAADFIEQRRHFGRLVHAGDQERVWEAVQAAVSEHRTYEITYRINTADGVERWVWEQGCGVYDADGNLTVLEGFITDITAHQRMERELRASAEQLRTLAGQLLDIREKERTDIAREIHDVLAQELTRLKIDLIWLGRRLEKALDGTRRPPILERLKDMTVQADTAIQTVQKIATELRPVILDSLGLYAAIEWQAEDFEKRSGIRCRVTVPRRQPRVDRAQATAFFRILQESLTNVLRHAGATEVDVALAVGDGQLALTVADNGRGISADRLMDPHSIGLVGMRERALAFSGTVDFSRGRDGGTRVTARMPLLQAAEAVET